jgi:hypothetical protein
MPTTHPTQEATMDQPVYNHQHGGHSSDDPRYTTVGFDVVRTGFVDGVLHIDVVQTVHGDGTSYMEALTAAKALRVGSHYGYPAERYACGCRWIATATDGNVVFTDLASA